ncbi:MAG: hypothetical protein ACRELA_09935 [Candidatus Rokuibacteriota bacterium]
MTWMKQLTIVIGALAVAVGAGSVARAQTAAALVLEARGTTVPAVQPFTEIPVGAVVSLAAGSKLTFMHYKSCRAVAVAGGEIRFEADTYAMTGGTKELDEPRKCPRRVGLKGTGDPGGVILRNVPPPLTLSVRPSFVLVGAQAGDFASIRVLRGSEPVLEVPLASRRFQWPREAAP